MYWISIVSIKKLRVLLFNEIEKIEIAFREAVANVTARMSGDIFWMTDSSHFRNQVSYAKRFSFIDAGYKKSTEDFIKHFKNTYSDPYAPAWMISRLFLLVLQYSYTRIWQTKESESRLQDSSTCSLKPWNHG